MYKVSWKIFIYRTLKLILGVLAIVAALASLIVLFKITGLNADSYDKKYIMDTGWTVQFDERTFVNVTLSSFDFPKSIDKGDKVVLYNVLPKSTDFNLPVLKLQTYSSVINVYLNGDRVYSYGEDIYSNNGFVGNGYHCVSVTGAGGDSIKIELIAAEWRPFSSVEQIELTDYSNVFKQMVVGNRITFVACIFLILFGIIVMGVSGWIIIKRPVLSMLFWIGLLSLSIGTWTSCNYGFAQLFNVSMPIATTLEYSGLLMGMISAIMYFKDYVWRMDNARQKFVFSVFAGLICVFSAVILTLHVTDILHMPSLLTFIHAVIGAEAIYIIVLIVRILKSGGNSEKVLFTGFCILTAFVFAEIISYILKVYTDIDIMDRAGVSVIGTIVFVAFMFINFSMDLLQKLKAASEKEIFYKMAYTDALTKIPNRRYCEKVMNDLSEREEPYGIFSFDLNDLKYINDNMGHNCGDDLIAGFADILKETFGTDEVIGRMGGDEFIAIVRSGPDYNHMDFISRLNEIMERENKRENRFQYKVSYGYADSSELTSDNGHINSHDIYAIADDRMYVCKRESKEKNSDGLKNKETINKNEKE